MNTKKMITAIVLLTTLSGVAQAKSLKPKLTPYFSGETYFSYDFGDPATGLRPGFIYSHNRHNQFHVNHALLGLKATHDRYRAAVGLQGGTYVEANYAAEPDLLKVIYEANFGLRLFGDVWLDAGIMPSHIGFETAIGAENWTLTRSMMADNSPYFETGAKLTYQPNDRWMASFLVLNGWQNIQDNNANKAVGTQVQFRPSDKLLLNSSTYVGKETPLADVSASHRFFHDFYVTWAALEWLDLALSIDTGMQRFATLNEYKFWGAAGLFAKFKPWEKVNFGVRAEYFHDPDGVVILSGTPNGFKTFGASVNVDWMPVKFGMLRLEGRGLINNDSMFTTSGGGSSSANFTLTSSLAMKF